MALEILSKKVAGVPVVYLAAGAVAILAVVAWRMKPSDSSADVSPESGSGGDAVLDENGHADGSDPYAGMATNGTVIVQPTPPAAEPEADKPDTNEEWVKLGAEWLVAEKNVSGSAAYDALNKFVEGKSRSTTEQSWIDAVIRAHGLPPDGAGETPLPPTPSNPAPTPTGFRGYGWVMADGKTSGADYAAKYKIAVSLFQSWNSREPRVPTKGHWLKVRANSNPLTGYAGK